MRYVIMPFTENNYKILKTSKYYEGGGRTFDFLKNHGYTGTVLIIDGEIHGSRFSFEDFKKKYHRDTIITYAPLQFKLK